LEKLPANSRRLSKVRLHERSSAHETSFADVALIPVAIQNLTRKMMIAES
jgi:hypothetical protein